MTKLAKVAHNLRLVEKVCRTKEKITLLIYLMILSIGSILDVIGILVVGIIIESSNLSGGQITNIESSKQSIFVIALEQVRELSTGSLIGIAFGLFALKTILTMYFSSKLFMKLAQISSRYSIFLLEKIFGFGRTEVLTGSGPQYAFALTIGVQASVMDGVGYLIIAISESIFISVVMISLIMFNPSLALFISIFFLIKSIVLVPSGPLPASS